MNIAQKILKARSKHNLSINDILQTSKPHGEADQDWEEGTTTFTFEDNSKLKFTDNEVIEVTA